MKLAKKFMSNDHIVKVETSPFGQFFKAFKMKFSNVLVHQLLTKNSLRDTSLSLILKGRTLCFNC